MGAGRTRRDVRLRGFDAEFRRRHLDGASRRGREAGEVGGIDRLRSAVPDLVALEVIAHRLCPGEVHRREQ